jgi:hypothetical protein
MLITKTTRHNWRRVRGTAAGLQICKTCNALRRDYGNGRVRSWGCYRYDADGRRLKVSGTFCSYLADGSGTRVK